MLLLSLLPHFFLTTNQILIARRSLFAFRTIPSSTSLTNHSSLFRRSSHSLRCIHDTATSSGLEALLGYISGKKKATEVAHSVWQHIARKGDIVVDATCGNGHDTLALLEMVADNSSKVRVYGMDIQSCALEKTSLLLEESFHPLEKEQVALFHLCHSGMEDIVPRGTSVRLVAFNLGYLPGGDKTVVTLSEKTLLALQAASRLLGQGGLISIMVYVGHPGGREEYDMVQSFASGLPVADWVCSKFEMLNRPSAPVLVFLFKN